MGQAAAWAASDSGVANQTPSYRECTWSGVTAAQIPSYIFCVLEKSLDLVSQGTLLGKEIKEVVDKGKVVWNADDVIATLFKEDPSFGTDSKGLRFFFNFKHSLVLTVNFIPLERYHI